MVKDVHITSQPALGRRRWSTACSKLTTVYSSLVFFDAITDTYRSVGLVLENPGELRSDGKGAYVTCPDCRKLAKMPRQHEDKCGLDPNHDGSCFVEY